MRVSDYWFDFAQTGKPTSGGSPESPSGNGSRDSTMEFGEANLDQNELYEARLNVFIGPSRSWAQSRIAND